jgi:drug/metabolite transporter (DMT)-like permease
MMMLVGCGNDIIVKFMGERLDTLQVLFCRFFFGLVTLLPFAIRRGVAVFKTKQLKSNLIRGVLGAVSFFLYTHSVMHLLLVEVVTILWTIPLFIIVLSRLLLGERVTVVRWAATLVGFFGLSAITLYNGDTSLSLKLLYIIPISSAFLFALQDVMIKKIVGEENRSTMLLYFAIVTSVLTIFPAMLVWISPTPYEYIMLFLLGAGGNGIQYFLFKALRETELSALAPFRYLEFLFSATFAFVFFSEIPGINVLIGAIILVPSTLYLAYTERKKT